MKKKVLFVCLGNICRSPLAEAVFNHQVRARGLNATFEADSCGTGDYHIGQEPDPRTWACASRNGIKMHHFGRQIQTSDILGFDYILAMDRNNYADIERLAPDPALMEKVQLLRTFDESGLEEVPDPFYGDEADFQKVYEILDRSITRLIDQLEADLKS